MSKAHNWIPISLLVASLILLAGCASGNPTPTDTPTPSDTPTETPTATPIPDEAEDPNTDSEEESEDSEDSGDSAQGPSSGQWLWVAEPHTITCPGSSNTYPATPSEIVQVDSSGEQMTISNANGSIPLSWNNSEERYDGTVTRSENGVSVQVLYTAYYTPGNDAAINGTVTWTLDGCSFYRAYTMTYQGNN